MQNDAELIRRTLDGDEPAFTTLVKKYQKHVHALAWRKIGDFHIAEDITQETFLKVHQNLATLKELERFPGWLYVIATRCCIARLRKKRMHAQLVEDIDLMTKGKDTYSQHVADEQAKMTTEVQREVVKKLLAKLQESDRTIVTLYYFGEMTCEEISKFLGVSANTIKSRLSRARQRLKKEEPLIQEALGTFQISPNLTQNIVQAVKEKGSSIKPVQPKGSKPLVPWAAVASTAIVAILILGMGNEYIGRFQQPYSLEATSEMKVDIVEAPMISMKQVKPAVKTQQSAISNQQPAVSRKSTRDVRSSQKADAGNNSLTPDSQQPIEETQQTQMEVLDFFRMPESGHLDYTVVHIDATAFEDGGTLTIDIRVGSGEAAGSFDLFDGDRKLPRGGIRRSSDALAHQWGIQPGGTGTITYQFDQGQVFRLGAASDWQSEKGSTNAFYAQISIRELP